DRGAFFDVDGTLISTNVVDAYAYYVFHRGTIFGTAQRLIRGLAMAPLYALTDRMNRKAFNELFYRAYRGLSEDRLVELAQDLCDKVLKPAVYPGALDIIAECRKAGCKIVLCTGAIDITMRPLQEYLGADDLIANSLQFAVLPSFRPCGGRVLGHASSLRSRVDKRDRLSIPSSFPTQGHLPTELAGRRRARDTPTRFRARTSNAATRRGTADSRTRGRRRSKRTQTASVRRPATRSS